MQKNTFVDYRQVLGKFTLQELDADSQDQHVLSYMASAAFQAIKQQESSALQLPVIAYVNEPGQPAYRVVTYKKAIPVDDTILFVGFLSKKQAAISATLSEYLGVIDGQMITRLTGFPALLSYSSLELSDGNWCNLVIFTQDALRDDLLATALHQHAAYELAPLYYQWIRIHRGLITIKDNVPTLCFNQTRYYTFNSAIPQPTIRLQSYPDALSTQDIATL